MTYRVMDDDDMAYAATNQSAGWKEALQSALNDLEHKGLNLIAAIPNPETQTMWVFRKDGD